MSLILAVDPGNTQSGFVLFNPVLGHVVSAGVRDNDNMLALVSEWAKEGNCTCAIEMIASYGMPVGKEVFDTCVWVGQFVREWKSISGTDATLVYRKDVKLHLCGTHHAKDSNIRQALLDKFGAQGTKKNKGPLYGVKSHMWAALAVAVTASERA